MKKKSDRGKDAQKAHVNKTPIISLCMIVKNEESCLGRCLKSIRDYVDEIIVVDTGSTDQSIEIAESYGARIYHHAWENDFSKHRNQSLSYATGDWIFQLDADEELFAEDGRILQEIARTGKADYYHCRFYDIKKDGSIHGTFYLNRLFRNGMGMCYERKVHNQLRPQGRGAYSSLRIRHYGYDLSQEQMEAKHIRTTTLLKEMLANDPEDVYSIYQLSSSYSMHREFDKAVAYGEKALELMRRKRLKNSYFLTVFHTVAHGYYTTGHVADAERTCLAALDFFPMHLDMCQLLADIYFRRQSFDQYRAIAQRYLSIYEEVEKDPAIVGGFFCHSFTRRHEIYFGLACVDFLEKNFEAADAFFQKSFEDDGRRMERADSICRFYLEQRMDEKAVQWLNRAYQTGLQNGSSPAVLADRNDLYLKIAGNMFQQGDMKSASDCLQKAQDAFLARDEQLEKRILQIQICWKAEAMDDLIRHLESLIALLGMNGRYTVQSVDDLGRIIYDVAETLCRHRQWAFAETALRLAVQISPAAFDHGKFNCLLHT
ncbi:MAG: glycosyltransferase family 2 protein [Pseudomonadota bacterium]